MGVKKFYTNIKGENSWGVERYWNAELIHRKTEVGHCGIHIGCKFGVLLVAAHDFALRIEEDYARDGGDAVDVGGDCLSIENLVPRELMLLDCLEGVFGLIPYGYAENLETFVGIFVVEFLDYSCLTDAGAAPACPEVNEGIFTFTHIVAQA